MNITTRDILDRSIDYARGKKDIEYIHIVNAGQVASDKFGKELEKIHDKSKHRGFSYQDKHYQIITYDVAGRYMVTVRKVDAKQFFISVLSGGGIQGICMTCEDAVIALDWLTQITGTP